MQMFRTPQNVVFLPSGDYFDSDDRVDVRPTRRGTGGEGRRVRPQLRGAVSLG
jgi:hypothetical protein